MNQSGDDDPTVSALTDAFRNHRPEPASDDQCPDPEAIFDAAAGELALAERQRIIDHVAACSHCGEAWRLAMAMGAGPADNQQPAPVTSIDAHRQQSGGGRRAPTLSRFAIAAGIGTLGVLVLLTMPRTDPLPDSEPGYRDAAGPASLQARSPEVLPRAQFLLRWTGAAEGSTYTLRITTADLEPVLTRAGIEATEYQVPEAALAGMAPGTPLLWQVETSSGGRRQASEARLVTIE